MSSKIDTTSCPSSSTATTALTPSSSNTKRLSTMKPSSPTRTKATLPSHGGVKEVVSPGELCGFVDTLLAQLEGRFDEMSEQVLGRMNEMSTRIDNLETAFQDLMTGGIDISSPAPQTATSASSNLGTPTPSGPKRS